MELTNRVLNNLKERRENLLNGNINCIPSPFVRFRNDFVGLEQGTYLGITSYTKGSKTQFTLNLLFEALMFTYEHQDVVRLKIIYFVLEETPERIIQRFMSWLLFRFDKIRISPRDLRSTQNDKPLDEDILKLLQTEKYQKYLDFFENCFIFSTTANPTGIYLECKKYADANGTIHTIKVDYSKNEVFDYYEPTDPKEYRIIVVDHIGLCESEKGLSKKETIDKLSEYLAKFLRNRYGFIPIIIQQQSVEGESNDSFKLQRNRPSGANLSDSKYTQRDLNLLIGLFSPFKFGLREYLGYDITKFKDHIRFLEICVNRDGELGGIIALFFDGATCTFKELPPPEDKEELDKIYNYLKSIETPPNKSKSFFIKFKQLFKI